MRNTTSLYQYVQILFTIAALTLLAGCLPTVEEPAKPTAIDVPGVVGMPQAVAEVDLVAADLSVGNVSMASSISIPTGNVINQTPAACSACATSGDIVDLVVSSGTTVPDVVDKTEAQAEADLVAAGLVKGTVTTDSSTTIAEGNVISQLPAAGGGASAGDGVNLVVSSGRPLLAFTNGQAADVVIGQDNFFAISANQSGTADADTLNTPLGNVAVINDVLYIADSANNRVLGYNSVPTVNGAAANFALGQLNFTQTTPSLSANKFRGPQAPDGDGGKFSVTDFQNHRVMLYNSTPISGPGMANVAVGQADLGSYLATCADSRISGPETSIMVDGKMIVTDTGNHRVLIWNSIPTISGTAADIVLGQPNFVTCDANNDPLAGNGPSARTMDGPAGVWSDGQRLIVLDRNNNRVLIWNSFPTASHAPADLVLGQSDFTNVMSNDDDQDGTSDSSPTARTLDTPYAGVHSNGKQLCVADHYNHRVLIWDSIPTQNFQPADRVLGQNNFVTFLHNDTDDDDIPLDPSGAAMNGPAGCRFHNDQLLMVSDAYNSRVLIFVAP